MKLLHVTPHLGGGVGKAHAALSAALPRQAVEQTFLLLEEPRDRRYAGVIEANGARVVVADSLDHVARLAGAADIVQFEFWNHPRLLECLVRTDFPPIRCVFWSHISGLSSPLIPPGLVREAARFVFTTEASFGAREAATLRVTPKKLAVINSGFGFAGAPAHSKNKKKKKKNRRRAITYLGTVDFVKMHPGFFDVIDAITDDIKVSVWGKPTEAVRARAAALRHPGRVVLRGETSDPAAALAESDIFFYPLLPDHYGTAENALVEAMSLGLVPVVMNNPAELAIVRDADTGFVAASIEECAALLQMLLLLPDVLERISGNAIKHVAGTRMPEISAREFMILWLGLLGEPPRRPDFQAALGGTPAEWFTATQGSPRGALEASSSRNREQPSKGTLTHFETVFAGDPSLAQLRKSG